MLTKITETTYSNRGTSSYSLNSVNSASSFDTIVKALFGNREYEEVDLTANGVLNSGDNNLTIPNMNI